MSKRKHLKELGYSLASHCVYHQKGSTKTNCMTYAVVFFKFLSNKNIAQVTRNLFLTYLWQRLYKSTPAIYCNKRLPLINWPGPNRSEMVPCVFHRYSTQVLEIVLTALAKTPMISGNWCVRRAIIAVEVHSPAVKWMKNGSSFFG